MRKLLTTLLAASLALALFAETPAAGTPLPLATMASTAAARTGVGTEARTTIPAGAEWKLFPALDSLAPDSLDPGLDSVSSGLAGATMVLPLVLAVELAGDEALSQALPSAGLAYAGSLALTWTAKEILKSSLPRARPYAGNLEGMGEEAVEEAFESFPSGHSSMAFCAATALAVVSARFAPDSRLAPWLVGGSYSLATGTAVLRVLSGAHYPTDVLAGSLLGVALGAAIGFLVPERLF